MKMMASSKAPIFDLRVYKKACYLE